VNKFSVDEKRHDAFGVGQQLTQVLIRKSLPLIVGQTTLSRTARRVWKSKKYSFDSRAQAERLNEQERSSRRDWRLRDNC
jgi:hypothetical protein